MNRALTRILDETQSATADARAFAGRLEAYLRADVREIEACLDVIEAAAQDIRARLHKIRMVCDDLASLSQPEGP